MKKIIVVSLVAALAAPALSEETFKVEPERRALLISVIEGLGCTVDGTAPPPAFLEAMQEHEFNKDETKAIAAQLVEEGLAVRDGRALVLKTEKCS